MPQQSGFFVLEHEFAARSRAVTSRRIGRTAVRILGIVAGARTPEEATRRVADAIRDTVGFEAVWFRLRRDGDFPILATRDAPAAVIDSCSRLGDDHSPGLSCLCGAVLTGDIDPDGVPGLTRGGSFWTGSTSRMLADGTYTLAGTGHRLHCHHHGYETQVLVPLRARGETVGLLQLCDPRPDLVDAKLVANLEELGRGLALALAALEDRRRRDLLENDLRSTEAWFRTITDFRTDVISVVGADGVVNFISPTVEARFGRPAHALIGADILDNVHPEDRTRCLEMLRRAEAECGSRQVSESVRIRRDDGDYRYFDIGALSPGNAEGIDGIVVNAHDVTERVRGRRRLATFKTIHETAAYGSVILDVQGDILYLNPAYADLVGRPREDLLGLNIAELVDADHLDALGRMQERLAREGRVSCWEFRHRRGDGTSFPGLMSIVASRDAAGEIDYYAASVIDITAQKQAEEELRALNLELETRVETRTRELQETRDRLEEKRRQSALSELLVGFAHEINTPLGVGITAASLLQDRVAALAGGSGADAGFLDLCGESSRLICRNLERVAALVDTFKRLSPDRLSEAPREVNLREAVTAATLDFRARLDACGHALDLDCHEDLRVVLRTETFSLVLEELVRNSLTHGFEDRAAGRISVCAETVGGELRLRYADNGVGLETATLERIFDPFFTTRRDGTGSGLGMHIVHNLVTQALEGSIEVDGAPGRGVVVTLHLPIDTPGD